MSTVEVLDGEHAAAYAGVGIATGMSPKMSPTIRVEEIFCRPILSRKFTLLAGPFPFETGTAV